MAEPDDEIPKINPSEVETLIKKIEQTTLSEQDNAKQNPLNRGDLMAEDKYNKYLEYLDREMTIMGILSAFCVGVVSLVLDRIFSAKQPDNSYFSEVAAIGWQYVVLGSASILIAALAFYHQRLLCSMNSGGICYHEARKEVERADEYFEKTYPWAFWINYRLGIGALVVGLVEYCLAFLSPKTICLRRHITSVGLFPLVITAAFLALSIRIILSEKYKNEDHPVWERLRDWLRKDRKT